MQYVSQCDAKGGVCIFCEKAAGTDDRSNHVVYRGEGCFILLNTFPYNTGHLMVAPYRHTGDPEELEEAERIEMMRLAFWSRRVLAEAMHPDGFNLGLNLGRPAGAGITDHIHMHVVPRWNGDTNFMTTVAGAKVMPESLEDVWERFREAAGRVGDPSPGGKPLRRGSD